MSVKQSSLARTEERVQTLLKVTHVSVRLDSRGKTVRKVRMKKEQRKIK